MIVAVSVVCCVLSLGAGWVQGGQFVAVSALLGMVSAAAGGLVAWVIVAMMSGPNAPVTAAPMLGLMVRLVVTGAGVGLLVAVFGFEKRPVLFAALFGYLVLMATETILLYRFASCSRSDARPTTVESDRQDS